MANVFVSGGFDDLRSRQVRFLQEASRFGDVHVQLWSDQSIRALLGSAPRFPQEERHYFIDAVRYVKSVEVVDVADPHSLVGVKADAGTWVVDRAADSAATRLAAGAGGLGYQVIDDAKLQGFPTSPPNVPGKPKVIVTGCFDWVHTGHVRFFEEASEYGELYVVVGHDKNIELLKGPGHPLLAQEERRYVVGSIRYVTQALISSGNGWMDAEPEIARIKPDMYIVNEDGDKPEKRAFCEEHGLKYLVLKRLPKPGLTRRQSTALRGF